jgi:hypothetical protein
MDFAETCFDISIFQAKTKAQKYIHALRKLYVFSHRAQQNWVCNFLIFYTNLYRFYRFSQNTTKGKESFCEEALGKF